MKIPGFVGGSNVQNTKLFADERSINLYPNSGQVGVTKSSDGDLLATWGLRIAFTVGASECSCVFSQDGRAFGVAGVNFFEFFTDETFIIRGTVAVVAGVVPTISSNGTAGGQLFVTAGLNGYIFTLATNAFAIIADMDFPNGFALMGEFFGGYFFVLHNQSRQFQWSALEDGTDWDALDVAERSWGSDDLMFLKRNHTDIWMGGSRTSEVWYATGGVEVFAPAQGSFIERGCIASFSVGRVEQTLAWLDQDERGGGLVVIAKGYQPADISTYAIAQIIQNSRNTMSQFRGFITQEQGHICYVLWNPSGDYDTSLVYDFNESRWHERAEWDSTNYVWVPWRAGCHCFAFERHWVGDRLSGTVYRLDPLVFDDELAVV